MASAGKRPGANEARRTGGWQRKGDGVLDKLGQRIVIGRYASGERLPTEEALTRELGVSRPSVREGMKALARKVLVESRTRRCTIALGKVQWDVLDRDVLAWMALAPPDHEFLIGLVEARTIFEPAAARLAANRATPAQIMQIERAFQGMVNALPNDVDACCLHDLAFHEGIIAAAGNVLVSRLATAIRTALLTLFRVSADARESYESSLAEHGAVAAAIRQRNPEEAERAMHKLLAGTVRDLKPAISKRRPARASSKRPGSRGAGTKARRP
jgi:GntR family galactonate operon transcriptional repressor